MIVASAAEGLGACPPDHLETHPDPRRVHVGLERLELRVLLKRVVEVDLLAGLIASQVDLARAKYEPGVLPLWLVTSRVELEAHLEIRCRVLTVLVHVHRVEEQLVARPEQASRQRVEEVGVPADLVYRPPTARVRVTLGVAR